MGLHHLLTITILQVEYCSFTEQNNFRAHEFNWIKQFDSIFQGGSLLPGHTVCVYRESPNRNYACLQSIQNLACRDETVCSQNCIEMYQGKQIHRVPLFDNILHKAHAEEAFGRKLINIVLCQQQLCCFPPMDRLSCAL